MASLGYNEGILTQIVLHENLQTGFPSFKLGEPLTGDAADVYTHEVDTNTFRVRVGSIDDEDRQVYILDNFLQLSAFLFGNEKKWEEKEVSVRALVPLHTYDEDTLKKMESIIYESGGFCRRCYDTNDQPIVWGVIDFTSF